MSNAQQLEQAQKVMMQNYGRQPLVMARGAGSRVWDADGREYLDLFAGFGAGILGHSHPALVEAASSQAQKLWHVGNTFYNEPQIEFAERLTKTAFPGQAFFCHSGLEANEAAVKLARLNGQANSRWKIISLTRSFHGRSLAMIAATGNPAVRVGFDPVVPGFVHVEAGDFAALKNAVDGETAGIIMEPIQGEGGIYPFSSEYVRQVRQLCDEHGLLLIFDEVWTGCGRTGKWFGHQYFTRADGSVITPDVMTLGKAVGGGLPVGVVWAKPETAELFVPGKHGCTLGGNAICMAVSRTIFDVIEKENYIAHANTLGDAGMAKLRLDARIAGKVKEVRGRGLFIGIELNEAPKDLIEIALKNGLLINVTSQKIVRIAPPINITQADWDDGLERTIRSIAECR